MKTNVKPREPNIEHPTLDFQPPTPASERLERPFRALTHAAPFLFLGATTLILCGCSNSPATRIQEKSAIFAQLTPTLQQAVKSGKVGIGFSREMTYMALGKPNMVVSSADGREIAWTYMNYNTPEAEVVLQNKHAVSSDILGSHNLVLGIAPPGKNSQTHTSTLADDGGIGDGDGGTGWRTVAGRADFDHGDVAIPDPTVRQKTAMERVSDTEERQDLMITFRDGKIVDFQFLLI